MEREINNPENRGYADNGIQEYKDAAARFMEREFGVKLDPATEINHCIGSKPALAHSARHASSTRATSR